MLLYHSSEVAPFLGWQERPTRWETMGVDMLLFDFQATMMPATVNVNLLATHRPNTSPDLTYADCYNTSWSLRLHVWQRVARDSRMIIVHPFLRKIE
ncbi:unnamed protein product [Eruca vesicaria subsp. sativa]|uniref:Uncharacterized protein n=1 Tax=Eruca vesicaria subsp. sativa TaxID=29727 RepID=A0ABC8M280_ERUVS|nr:unnamed protein product [Eruca vesicaria subsp. sativa]